MLASPSARAPTLSNGTWEPSLRSQRPSFRRLYATPSRPQLGHGRTHSIALPPRWHTALVPDALTGSWAAEENVSLSYTRLSCVVGLGIAMWVADDVRCGAELCTLHVSIFNILWPKRTPTHQLWSLHCRADCRAAAQLALLISSVLVHLAGT